MDGNQEWRGWLGPALIAGVAGFAVWRSLSPNTKESIRSYLEVAAAEHHRRNMAELAQAEQLVIPSLEDLDFGSYSLDIPPTEIESIVEAAPLNKGMQVTAKNYEWFCQNSAHDPVFSLEIDIQH